MKSLKKTLVLLVVFSMILSAVMPAFAATDVYGLDCEEEVTRLEALGIVTGMDAEGNYAPEETITRAQMAVILCKMVGIDEVTADENKVVPSKFSDVKVNEWYTGFVNVAAGKGLLSGFPDGTFRPNEQLTMNQVLTLCVNALGRGEYVSEMGAWPANYIAEATKLGLLDGVKTSDANRGNIAIIAWNTLEAPYVWDVTHTEYEGSINLGDSTRSLLSIYFRDFVAEEKVAGTTDSYLKEAEYVEVTAVPSTNGELGDNQIVLVDTVDTDADSYDVLVKNIRENKKPRGTEDEEWTTANGYEITAYAPAFNNLDSYFGKIVTVIFGKDNEVVSIRVIDETVDNEYLTAYDDKKLEIGENEYKFADDARVYINTLEMTREAVAEEHSKDCKGCAAGSRCADFEAAIAEIDADAAMTRVEGIIGVDFDEKYNKVVKANVVLNGKGRVTRLDLLVSGDYEVIGTYEVVVEKVRNEVITLDNNEEIDYSEDGKYEDEDDQPRVMKDGSVIGLEEIAVGDVLTYFVNEDGDITTVYVSSNKVAGELTRASKEDYKLTVDGEAYYSSMEELYVTNDKVADAKKQANAEAYIGENVELYMNVYGEYVLVASEEAEETWVFGIVTRVDEEEEDEEDDNIFYKDIRVLLADGTTARNYKFVFDDEEDSESKWNDIVDTKLENKFIVFAPDANGEIAVDDYTVIEVKDNNDTIANGDYEVELVAKDATVDNDRERIGNKIFGDNTVIFNLGYNTQESSYDPETSTSWKALVTGTPKALAQDTLLIYEEDAKTLSYVLINVSNYATSDAEYAIVLKDDYKEKRTSSVKKYTELLTLNGEEEFELKNGASTLGAEDKLVEYKLSGSKLDSAKWLLDLVEIEDTKADEEVKVGTHINTTNTETKLAVNVAKKYEATELAGSVKPSTLTEDYGNIEGNYYIYTIKGVYSDTYAMNITQVNPVLEMYKGKDDRIEEVDGEWTKVVKNVAAKTTGSLDDTILVKAGSEVKVTVEELDAKGNVVAVRIYDIDATDLEIASTATATTVTPVGAEKYGVLKANFKVVDTQKLLLEYEDDEDEVPYSLGEVVVDEDVIVIDARNGELKETTFSALRDEVAEEGYLYVIPFANQDAEGYAEWVLDSTKPVDANILVIVD